MFPARTFHSVAQHVLDFLREVIASKYTSAPGRSLKISDQKWTFVAMGIFPDDGKGLPPPGIVNRNSLWLGTTGWLTAMLQNAINHRPPLKAGQHVCQLASRLTCGGLSSQVYAILNHKAPNSLPRHGAFSREQTCGVTAVLYLL